MEIVNNIEKLKFQKRAVTFGKFDGIHLGHQQLIKEIVSKKQAGMIPTVFTFEKLEKSQDNKTLLTKSERESLLEFMGVETIFEYLATKENMSVSAKSFVTEIIKNKFNAGFLAVGEDFRFGHNREGDVELLEKMSKEAGFELKVVEKKVFDNERISSSRIRNCLVEGRIDEVNTLLGYEYSVTGEIVKGNQLGRTWNIPTINITWPFEKLSPKYGVYFSKVVIKDENADREFFGMTNLGKKPSIAGEYLPGTETYLYNCNEDLYGKTAIVKLLYFRRAEQKFESIDLLKETLYTDIAAGEKYFY